MDGAVDVAFGSEVNNGAGPLASQQMPDEIAIDNVSLPEALAGMVLDGTQIVKIAGVGEFVEIENAERFGGRAVCGKAVQDEVGADEAGAAGDQDEIVHVNKRRCT